MLSPKRTKYRKAQKGNNRGMARRGSDVSFGDFAMQATETGRVTARQIEAARMAINSVPETLRLLRTVSTLGRSAGRGA